MKHKLIAILFGISILSLTACGNTTETVSKNVANTEAENIEIGEEISYEWQELGYLESYPEIRNTFDEIMGTSILTSEGKEGMKGGTCYINMDKK